MQFGIADAGYIGPNFIETKARSLQVVPPRVTAHSFRLDGIKSFGRPDKLATEPTLTKTSIIENVSEDALQVECPDLTHSINQVK